MGRNRVKSYAESRQTFHNIYRLGPCISETFIIDNVKIGGIPDDEHGFISFRDLIGDENYKAWHERINRFKTLTGIVDNENNVVSIQDISLDKMSIEIDGSNAPRPSFGISLILRDLRSLAKRFLADTELHNIDNEVYYSVLPYGGLVEWEAEHSPLLYRGIKHAAVFTKGMGDILVGNIGVGSRVPNQQGGDKVEDEDVNGTNADGNELGRGTNSHDRATPLIYDVFGHLERDPDCKLNKEGFVQAHAHMMMFFNEKLAKSNLPTAKMVERDDDESESRFSDDDDDESKAPSKIVKNNLVCEFTLKPGSIEHSTYFNEQCMSNKLTDPEKEDMESNPITVSTEEMYRIYRMYLMSLQRGRFVSLPLPSNEDAKEKHFLLSLPSGSAGSTITFYGKMHIHYRVLMNREDCPDAEDGDFKIESLVQMGLEDKFKKFNNTFV